MTDSKKLPLSGIQVIDFGHKIAGPAVGMILADLGANVIQVKKPKVQHEPQDASFDRGKKCLSLDLKKKSDLAIAKKLIESADVLIENFRPGVLSRLGIDFENIVEKNSHIIALSLPAFSKSDAEMKNFKGTEATIQSYSGIFSEMGQNRKLMGIEPSFSPLPLASCYGAVIGAYSIVAALNYREKTGQGDLIEIPLAAALAEGIFTYNAFDFKNKPERYKNLREKEIERREKNNISFDMKYKELFSSEYMDPFYRSYMCKDKRPYYLVSLAHKDHSDRVMKALGVFESIEKKLKDMGLEITKNVHLEKKKWIKSASYVTYPVSPEWSKIISKEFEKAFLKKESLEWEIILGKAKAPGGAHRKLEEWMNTEHCQKSGLFVEVNDIIYGKLQQPWSVCWSEELSDDQMNIKSRQFIKANDILESWCKKNKAKTKPKQNKKNGWLEGVKILDLSNVIAAPHSTNILARHGAEVIKIDPPKPNFCPSFIFFALNSGQGKKNILVDIKTNEGYEILKKIIENVDVVVFNASYDQIKRIKLDKTSIKKINPHVVFCHIDLFGGPKLGPMTNHLGYDDVIQAVSGIMTRFGGNLKTPEEHGYVGLLDVMCGFASSLCIASALFHKKRTGETLRVRTSLAAVSGFLQIPFCHYYKKNEILIEPSGRMIQGKNSFSRFYKCQDTWVYVDSNKNELSKFSNILNKKLLNNDIEKNLEQYFKEKKSLEILDILKEYNIAASPLNKIKDIRKKFTVKKEEIKNLSTKSYSFIDWSKSHPSRLPLTLFHSRTVRSKNSNIYFLDPTEKYGQSTRSYLLELGYSKDDLDNFILKEIINESWSFQYLPT